MSLGTGMDPQTLPLGIQEVLAAQDEHWRQVAGVPSADLLRLSVLREVVRVIHAERSNVLARGDKAMAQSLLVWENTLNELRKATALPESLIETVRAPDAVRRRTRLLPEALFNSVPKDRLERHDRLWESAIAAEACAQAWGFWSVTTWVQVPSVESWTRRLLDHLWPYGILLFTESVGFLEHPMGDSPGNTEPALWNGRWTLVLDPRFATAADLPSAFGGWPGNPKTAPQGPQWKLLFSPKRR